MNWDQVDLELQTIANLSADEFDHYLLNLQNKSPDLAKTVSLLSRHKRRELTFLKTSSSDDYSPTNEIPIGTQFGIWQIDEPIESGGMGSVFKGHRNDGLYNQIVAIKIASIHSSSQEYRFNQERQRLANLEHPNIVRIIDGGVAEDNLAYIVMDFIDGQAIDDVLIAGETKENDILRHLIDTARAISHAHKRFILHRDIKPSNVLIDQAGHIKLIDFGISSNLTEQEEHSFSMTFAYAAPELLNEGTTNIATDIFAFGVLVHKLLTGELPRRLANGSVEPALQKIGNKELAAVVSKLLSHDADARYQSLDATIIDFENYLNNKPISVYSKSRSYQISKFLRRNPAISALTAGLIIALSGGLATSLYSSQQVRQALIKTENALQRERLATLSEAAFSETLQSFFDGDLDSDLINSIMLDRASEAHELRTISPTQSAQTIFAIGRSLTFRGDYLEAKTVLEPWISEDYGPELLKWQGKVDLAIAKQLINKQEDTLGTFRAAAEFFDTYSSEPTYEKVLVAQQISKATYDKDDTLRTISLAQQALQTEATDNEKLYYYSCQIFAHRSLGNNKQAYDAVLNAMELLNSNPMLDRHRGMDIRFFGADFSIYMMNDFNKAQQILDPILERKNLGDFQAYIAHHLSGTALAEAGKFEDALQSFEKAKAYITKATGNQSRTYSTSIADLIELDLLMGNLDGAGERITVLKKQRENTDAQYSGRYYLAEAHYLLKAGKPSDALNLLKEHDITPTTASESYMKYRMNKLRALGLKVDSLS